MYVIVNKAIEGLITEKFGPDIWKLIKKSANVDVDNFSGHQPYDDSVTFDLIKTSSEILNVSPQQILFVFGKYWSQSIARESDLVQLAGKTFRTFIIGLPEFYKALMLLYPAISTSEFKIKEVDNHIDVEYHSTRLGLADFIEGFLNGSMEMFGQEASISITKRKIYADGYDTFRILLKK